MRWRCSDDSLITPLAVRRPGPTRRNVMIYGCSTSGDRERALPAGTSRGVASNRRGRPDQFQDRGLLALVGPFTVEIGRHRGQEPCRDPDQAPVTAPVPSAMNTYHSATGRPPMRRAMTSHG